MTIIYFRKSIIKNVLVMLASLMLVISSCRKTVMPLDDSFTLHVDGSKEPMNSISSSISGGNKVLQFGGNFNTYSGSISIYVHDSLEIKATTYEISKEPSSVTGSPIVWAWAALRFRYSKKQTFNYITDSTYKGILTITKVDYSSKICSGYFSFKAVSKYHDSTPDYYHVDGTFNDMKFN